VLSHAARESRRAIRILRLYKHQLVIFANAHPLAKPAAFARAEVLFAGYLKLVAVPRGARPAVQHPHITIDNHCPSRCGTKYRFRSKEDMLRLFKVLRIPAMFSLDNGEKISGEHLFLVFMSRMTKATGLEELVEEYGRSKSVLSRGLYAMARFLYAEHKGKIRNGLDKWAGHFTEFSAAICAVANASVNKTTNAPNNPNFSPAAFPVACVIDCNNTPSCRVGSGPVGPGVGASRKSNRVQMAFYNGWLHAHGYKHQSVELPNGLTVDWWGPTSMRENDIWMATHSSINAKLAAAQQGIARQFVAFGDSIYVPDTHIRRRHHAAAGHANQGQLDREDCALNSVREFVENHYGQLDQLFPYTRNKLHNKIASGMPIKEISFCRVLFRNCHVCMYENQTSKRFDLEPPSLEDYFKFY
jgi:hypothetical protein